MTGRYSGKQPAMTALIAIFSIEQGAHFGGIVPITSAGSRRVAVSILSTRSTVGGTIGKPSLSFSLQNQSLTASQLFSTSMRFEVRFIMNVGSYGLRFTIYHDRVVPPLSIFFLPPCREGLRKGELFNVSNILATTPSTFFKTSLFQNRRTMNP